MKKQKTMKFKDFEIRPMRFIDGHTDPKIWEVVKWRRCEPREVIDVETGKKKISDTYCFVTAFLEWNEKEPCWEMHSVGTRFLEYYEEGLSEFILKWLELNDLARKFMEEA